MLTHKTLFATLVSKECNKHTDRSVRAFSGGRSEKLPVARENLRTTGSVSFCRQPGHLVAECKAKETWLSKECWVS